VGGLKGGSEKAQKFFVDCAELLYFTLPEKVFIAVQKMSEKVNASLDVAHNATKVYAAKSGLKAEKVIANEKFEAF